MYDVFCVSLINLTRCGQALKVSKKDSKRVAVELPLAPVYYPTLEEFHDTLGYIQK